ncbi:hypothetical protein [Streptosporangium sp. NPDC049046]|uniref:hypothetical protein n=1 Tax=Streptosporangium sp. NPDC049046 TaxID=3155031 RepID=UPI0034137DAE
MRSSPKRASMPEVPSAWTISSSPTVVQGLVSTTRLEIYSATILTVADGRFRVSGRP